MGYGVYEDPWHFGRWAGYMVPAECDQPGCSTMIDRGLGYQCEKYWDSFIDVDTEEEIEVEHEGCYLYFCSEHSAHTDHEDAEPKPDHPRWMWWILNHESWEKWCEENPKRVAEYVEATKDFEPDAELLEELADA